MAISPNSGLYDGDFIDLTNETEPTREEVVSTQPLEVRSLQTDKNFNKLNNNCAMSPALAKTSQVQKQHLDKTSTQILSKPVIKLIENLEVNDIILTPSPSEIRRKKFPIDPKSDSDDDDVILLPNQSGITSKGQKEFGPPKPVLLKTRVPNDVALLPSQSEVRSVKKAGPKMTAQFEKGSKIPVVPNHDDDDVIFMPSQSGDIGLKRNPELERVLSVVPNLVVSKTPPDVMVPSRQSSEENSDVIFIPSPSEIKTVQGKKEPFLVRKDLVSTGNFQAGTNNLIQKVTSSQSGNVSIISSSMNHVVTMTKPQVSPKVVSSVINSPTTMIRKTPSMRRVSTSTIPMIQIQQLSPKVLTPKVANSSSTMIKKTPPGKVPSSTTSLTQIQQLTQKVVTSSITSSPTTVIRKKPTVERVSSSTTHISQVQQLTPKVVTSSLINSPNTMTKKTPGIQIESPQFLRLSPNIPKKNMMVSNSAVTPQSTEEAVEDDPLKITSQPHYGSISTREKINRPKNVTQLEAVTKTYCQKKTRRKSPIKRLDDFQNSESQIVIQNVYSLNPDSNIIIPDDHNRKNQISLLRNGVPKRAPGERSFSVAETSQKDLVVDRLATKKRGKQKVVELNAEMAAAVVPKGNGAIFSIDEEGNLVNSFSVAKSQKDLLVQRPNNVIDPVTTKKRDRKKIVETASAVIPNENGTFTTGDGKTPLIFLLCPLNNDSGTTLTIREDQMNQVLKLVHDTELTPATKSSDGEPDVLIEPPALVTPVDISEIINQGKRPTPDGRCKYVEIPWKGALKGFTKREMKKSSCVRTLDLFIKKEDKKITSLKNSMVPVFETNFVSCGGSSGDFLPEFVKSEADLIENEIDTIPTLSEVISKVNQEVLELKKREERKNVAKLSKPEEALQLIKKGLELIQSWSEETANVATKEINTPKRSRDNRTVPEIETGRIRVKRNRPKKVDEAFEVPQVKKTSIKRVRTNKTETLVKKKSKKSGNNDDDNELFVVKRVDILKNDRGRVRRK